jgi:hypothetical protein
MQGLRKENHFVPQLYLKQWAIGGKIQTYRLLVPNAIHPKWKPYWVSSIASHQHLYTRVIDGMESDEIERWLQQEFENPADRPLGRAVSGERLTPDDWKALVRFAFAQDVRTPARLKAFLVDQEKSLPALMQETLEEAVRYLKSASATQREMQAPPDAANQFPLKVTVHRAGDGDGAIGTEMVVGRALWLWSLRHTLTTTIRSVPMTGWTILHAPKGIHWPTSDNPLVRLNFTDASRYDFGGGWGVRNGDIVLPLSPKHLLFTCIGNRPTPRGTTLDERTARLLQKIIVEHADRHVFSREPFDVESIRRRVVSLEAYKREHDDWRRWGAEQRAAEFGLHGKSDGSAVNAR